MAMLLKYIQYCYKYIMSEILNIQLNSASERTESNVRRSSFRKIQKGLALMGTFGAATLNFALPAFASESNPDTKQTSTTTMEYQIDCGGGQLDLRE